MSGLGFVDDEDPDGSERQQDHRIVRLLRRTTGAEAVIDQAG